MRWFNKKGGRIFYVGAGSSGRIGMVDALDILPTFGEDNWFKYSMAVETKLY